MVETTKIESKQPHHQTAHLQPPIKVPTDATTKMAPSKQQSSGGGDMRRVPSENVVVTLSMSELPEMRHDEQKKFRHQKEQSRDMDDYVPSFDDVPIVIHKHHRF